jgi:hypothetical protein
MTRPRRLGVLLLLLLGGCNLGSFERLATTGMATRVPWAASRRMGCLDLGAHLTRHPEVPRDFVVIQYELGNRCEAAVRVDLSAVRVRARYPGGATVWLRVFDPRAELRPGALDARMHAFQPIAYAPGAGERAPEEVCVAPGRAAPDEAPREGDGEVLWCFPVPAYEELPVARGGFA